MRRLLLMALFVGVGASLSGGQQTSSSTPPVTVDAQPAKVKVYTVGPGVTAPELLSPNLQPIPPEKCKKKVDGKVELSLLVDAAGQPHRIFFLHPLGTDLDKIALQIAGADRFKPGTHDGSPVIVAQSLEMGLQACIVEKKDDAGKKTFSLRLRSQPQQTFTPIPLQTDIPDKFDISISNSAITKVGGQVSQPVPLNNVEAVFTDAARRAHFQGICLLSLIVDVQGMPQNVHVVKPLDYGLSENAVDSVNRYRFKPAMKDGMPVPVKINVEVNFRLYDRHTF
ncbi:MAG: energy transducer TonB [Terracidiphilus sp.]